MGNSFSESRQAADSDLRPDEINQTIPGNFSVGVPSIDSSKQTFVDAIVGGNITASNVTITNYPHYPVLRQMNGRSKFRFNIPTPTPNFKGREDTLKNIESYFTNPPENTSGSCWDRIVAIVGPGGMGKTETAYKFEAEFQTKFPNAACINAETKEAVLQSFLGLAKHLRIVPQDQSSAGLNLVKEVYRQMDQANCGRVLFIFDNAVKLSSAADEPGILDYLPTESLPNGRFPNIIITTQTQDWGRRIKTFQVGGLSEEESLAFYQSSFRVQSSECTTELKRLHVLLQGHPFSMSLAVSQIDFDPNRDSVDRLKKELSKYIKMFEEKQKQLLHEKVGPVRGNKYDETLSTVWKITCERLVEHPNGPKALEVVQIMSLLKLPIDQEAVETIFFSDPEYANLSKDERQLQLEELIRVLATFHLARTLQKTVGQDVVNWFVSVGHRLRQLVKRGARDYGEVRQHGNENGRYDVGIHPLIQLVVRQETDCSKIIERVLRYVTHLEDFKLEGGVNTALLFSMIAQNKKLSSNSLTYLGILTCQGNPQACQVFKARKSTTEVAATLWSSYKCIRDDSTRVKGAFRYYVNKMKGKQVLGQLHRLITSHESLRDRQLFADIMLKVLLANDSETVGNLQGIEELLTTSILRECSIDDWKQGFVDSDRQNFHEKLRGIYTRVLNAFIQSDAPDTRNEVGGLAESWLALLRRLKYYNPKDSDLGRLYWMGFWFEMYKIFKSPDCCQRKIVALVRCLWDRGLGETLIQAMQLMEDDLCLWSLGAILNCLEICLNGMELRDKRVQAVVLAFFNHFVMALSSEKSVALDLTGLLDMAVTSACALWIKLLLMDDEPPSQNLLQSWSRVGARPWIEVSIEVGIKSMLKDEFFKLDIPHLPNEYVTDYFPQFILKHSSSEDPEIQHVVHICHKIMEKYQVQKEDWERRRQKRK